MATTRFMRDLEVPLVEGQNSAAVDLFDLRHARKVLAAFGRAFGALPEGDIAKEHAIFLERAVLGLAQEGRVISVRLSLFAEMVKNKSWLPATLKEVGGTEGVGVAFLEETFGATTAPPEHRRHQLAARAVLRALLPEQGSEIKGHWRSYHELLEASGYVQRPREFDDLLRILDAELRLITPADPEGKDAGGSMKDETEKSADSSFIPQHSALRYYQLTHDYLVPALRQWLTRKQKETWRGRAELLLEERTGQWIGSQQKRYLPSWREFLLIRFGVSRSSRTVEQRTLMRAAARHYSALTAIAVIALVGLALTGLVIRNDLRSTHADGLIDTLMRVETSQVPSLMAELRAYRRWVNPKLAQILDDPRSNRKQHLHAGLVMLRDDERQLRYLRDRLLMADPQELLVIRQVLWPYRALLSAGLWEVLTDPQLDGRQRIRAACGLAGFEPNSTKWQQVAKEVVSELVREDTLMVSQWIALLQPVQEIMIDPLKAIFHDKQRAEQAYVASLVLSEVLANQHRLDDLIELAQTADDRQLVVLANVLRGQGDQAIPLLRSALHQGSAAASAEPARDALAKRQVNCALALMMIDQEDPVWPLLEQSTEPRIRSWLIHRIARVRIEPRILCKRLQGEEKASVRMALMLSLGEYENARLSAAEGEQLNAFLLKTYREDTDPGVHSAASWLLRRRGQMERLAKIEEALISSKPRNNRKWFINSMRQNMVVINGQVEFDMGSPPTEEGRGFSDQGKHRARIPHSYAIGACEVTVGQFSQLDGKPRADDRSRQPKEAGTAEGVDPTVPVTFVTMNQAAQYCNRLSEREAIPEDQWCYVPGQKAGEFLPKADFLSRSGYRLPTEEEWEYACRAGAITSRHFGQSDELLRDYAWYFDNSENRRRPVGLLKPNDLGLFDMLGNVAEWCEDSTDVQGTQRNRRAVLRGGSLLDRSVLLRAASRLETTPQRLGYAGFRVARTLP
jgi:formylglycine-generating enzyme required for sulfatase activity